MKHKLRHVLPLVIFGSVLILQSFAVTKAAPELSSRSVTIGTSRPGSISTYRFNFTVQSVANLGSMEFEFCINSPLVGNPCTPPLGFSASVATLNAQSGETGFSIDAASSINRIVISRPAAMSSSVPVSYTFGNITNPSDVGTAYVRIATYSSMDGTGPRTDEGGVAFSMVNGIAVASYVPPYLTFCVGVTVAGDCSSANGQSLNFGELVSNKPSFLTSQFAVATNDFTGYSATVNGVTMTSGTNVIPGLGIPQGSQTGVSQFGMNLRSNTNPAVGGDPSGIGTSSIAPDYAQPNSFVFKNQVVTTSNTSTDFNLFTVSYLVNVASSQPPGVYNTTLTYIATASF